MAAKWLMSRGSQGSGFGPWINRAERRVRRMEGALWVDKGRFIEEMDLIEGPYFLKYSFKNQLIIVIHGKYRESLKGSSQAQ